MREYRTQGSARGLPGDGQFYLNMREDKKILSSSASRLVGNLLLLILLGLIVYGYYGSPFNQSIKKNTAALPITFYTVICMSIAAGLKSMLTGSPNPLFWAIGASLLTIVMGMLIDGAASGAGPGYMFPVFHIIGIPLIGLVNVVAFVWILLLNSGTNQTE